MLYDNIILTNRNLLLLNCVNNMYIFDGVQVNSVCLAGLTIYEGRVCDSGYRKVSIVRVIRSSDIKWTNQKYEFSLGQMNQTVH